MTRGRCQTQSATLLHRLFEYKDKDGRGEFTTPVSRTEELPCETRGVTQKSLGTRMPA